MYFRYKIFCFISVLIGIAAELTSKERDDPNNDNLVCIITISRHGQRTPAFSYPKDPLNIDWPVGPGELLNRGKMLHYKLGQWLRERYNDFIPYKYSETDLLVHATDIDRVIMSGLSNLAGLFPPRGNSVWNEELLWQPIPIHIIEPNILHEFPGSYCPKYEELWRVDNSSKRNPLNKGNEEFYEFLEKNTGMVIESPLQVGIIRDVLFVQKDAGYTLPDWTKEVYPKKMNDIGVELYKGMGETKELARLAAGPFLNEVVKYFEGVIQDGTQKFRMFFAHDTNIASILSGLSSYPDHMPEYASTIIFELHKSKNYYVRIDYMYEFGEPPLEIQLPGCDIKCDFEQFKKVLDWVLIEKDQWDKECNET